MWGAGGQQISQTETTAKMTTCWDGIPDDCSRLALEADLAVTKCMECGRFGHRVSECPEVPRCVHCRQDGHRVSNCPWVDRELAVARESRLVGREKDAMQIRVRVTNFRRMLGLLGAGFLLGSAAAAAYWWIR